MTTAEPKIEDLVDQLGALEEKLNIPEVVAWKQREKAASELRKKLVELAGGDPLEVLTLHGRTHTAVLGVRENERSIVSMAKIFTKLGKSTFLKACKLSLTAFDALSGEWTDKEKAAVTLQERSGPRPVKTFRQEMEEAA